MKYRAAFSAIMLGMAACALRPPALTAAHRQAISDSVTGVLSDWREAFNARDFGRVAAFYSNDTAFRWIENGDIKYRSAHELADSMRAQVPSLDSLNLVLTETQVTPLAPGTAAVGATFTETIVDTAHHSFGLAGAVSMTLIHESGGWKILGVHLSLLRPESASPAGARAAGGRK